MKPKSSDGNASLAILGASLIFLAFLAGLADLGLFFHARAKAQTAADAAALAAAAELIAPGGRPHEQAARFASANGARLVSCECAHASGYAKVEVNVPIRFILSGYRTDRVAGRAKAEVNLAEP